jgi:hypothetical protein
MFYFNSESQKAQSIVGDLRLALANASNYSNKSVDNFYIGTSITHRLFSGSEFHYLGLVGHSLIDAIDFYKELQVDSDTIYLELNLFDKKKVGLKKVNSIFNDIKHQTKIRLSDIWTYKFYTYLDEKKYLSKKINKKTYLCDQTRNDFSHIDSLIRRSFRNKKIFFIYIPMSEDNYYKNCIDYKIQTLKKFNYDVIIKKKFLPTTDGLHLNKSGKKKFIEILKN